MGTNCECSLKLAGGRRLGVRGWVRSPFSPCATLNAHTWARNECAHTHTAKMKWLSCAQVYRSRVMGQPENISYLMNVNSALAGRWNQSVPSFSLPVSKRFSGDLRARNRRVTILHNSSQVRVGLASACRCFYLSAKVKSTASAIEHWLNQGQMLPALPSICIQYWAESGCRSSWDDSEAKAFHMQQY